MRRSIRRRLLAWYSKNHRDLPWRRRPGDGYAQLVAELMLQQTQAARVAPYFERFMARFPAIGDLAAAGIDDVLPLWSGLGYYRRARHLHAAARAIVERHGGRVPQRVEELMALPGIGRYTAGAVASIAYGRRAPVLDGNVARVLTRVLGARQSGGPLTGAARAGSPCHATRVGNPCHEVLWREAEALLPQTRCGDFNQALMELGATICTRSPQCSVCPLRAHCRAAGRAPATRRTGKSRRRQVLILAAALRYRDHILLVQRPDHGLWAGLWDLPSEVCDGDALVSARNRLRKRLPHGSRLARTHLPPVVRTLTHRLVSFHVYIGTASSSALPDGSPARWVSRAELPSLAISGACRALLRQMWPDL